MKHVIIAGSPRAGKTTMSKSLMSGNLGFTHYKMDSIKRGICESYSLKYDDWKDVSPIMCNIINKIIQDNKTDTNYGKEKYLFDTPFLYPKDIEKIDTSDTVIIFLGYAHIDDDTEVSLIREHDEDHYWTTKIDDALLKKWSELNIEYSKILEQECKRLNIKYFDTSYNRDEVLEEAKRYIIENNQ